MAVFTQATKDENDVATVGENRSVQGVHENKLFSIQTEYDVDERIECNEEYYGTRGSLGPADIKDRYFEGRRLKLWRWLLECRIACDQPIRANIGSPEQREEIVAKTQNCA